jgi:hypothetical protein
MLSEVYCLWQVFKTPTIILNNPVHGSIPLPLKYKIFNKSRSFSVHLRYINTINWPLHFVRMLSSRIPKLQTQSAWRCIIMPFINCAWNKPILLVCACTVVGSCWMACTVPQYLLSVFSAHRERLSLVSVSWEGKRRARFSAFISWSTTTKKTQKRSL